MEQIISRLEPLLTKERVRRMKSVLATRSDHVAFVFERMVDPHNLSAALRSMDAMSFQDAHLIEPAERIGLSRGISIGAERWLSLHDHSDSAACLAELRAAGYRIYASRVEEGQGIRLQEIDFSRRTALVFGNEHAGVSPELVAQADEAFHIGMRGFSESLNLSVAAAISAYHARETLERLAEQEQDPARYLLSEERRQAIYVEWLRQSVKKADQIIAELQGRGEEGGAA
ncbi:MAG: RNA methyltransferase [SAR324 cluster bacterium]|nr:RNA methyltransferase [SAR324 cluster bacterium]